MIRTLLDYFMPVKETPEKPQLNPLPKTTKPVIRCDCGNTETFVEGPSGGLCINVMCTDCKQWWNACAVNGQLLSFDKLEGRRG